MDKKIIMTLFACLLLLSFVSCELSIIETKGNINPFGNKKIILEAVTDSKINEDSFMLQEKSLDLPVVRISKTFLWIETDKIAEYKITSNDVSIINAVTTGKAILYQDGKLFDDASFKDIKGNLKNILDYQYYIKQNISYIVQEPDTYRTECVKTNSTNLTKGEELKEECYEVVDKYKDVTKYKEEWVKYDYETLKKGNYEWKLEGRRIANQKVDFIPLAQGLSLDEYVWWDEDWTYKREINLTASVGNFSYLATINYSAGMNNNFSDVRFVNSTENGELNFTIQNKTDGTNMTVRIFNKGSNKVYMYYGNANADVSTSNVRNLHFNPVSYWYLDGNVNDALGVNNGTINGASSTSSSKIGSAYSFVPANYIEFADSASLDVTQITVGGWFYIGTGNTGTYTILVKKFGAYTLQTWNNYLGFEIKTGSNFYHAESTTTINSLAGTWVFLLGTYDGETIKFYINGTFDSENTSPTGNIVDVSSSLRFGIYGDTGFNGIMDEIFIYNRSLTQDEITKLYTYTMPTYTVGSEDMGDVPNVQFIPETPENNEILNYGTFPINISVELFDLTFESISYTVYNSTGDLFQNFSTIYEFATTYQFFCGTLSPTNSYPDGDYYYNVTITTEEDTTINSETRKVTIDTKPFIEFVSPTPENASEIINPNITVYTNISTYYSNESGYCGGYYEYGDTFYNITYNLYNPDGLYKTQTYTTKVLNHTFESCGCDDYEYNVTICSYTGTCNTTETRSIFLDQRPPVINITSPLTFYSYLVDNQTLDLNFSVVDNAGHLDSCWYVYNETNVTLNCSEIPDIINYNRTNSRYFDLKPVSQLTNLSFKTNLSSGTQKLGTTFRLDSLTGTSITYCSGFNATITNNSIIVNQSSLDGFLTDINSYIKNRKVLNMEFFLANTTGICSVKDEYNLYGNITYLSNFYNTTFNYIPFKNELTLYANDTFGNVNSSTREWFPDVIELDVEYEDSVYATENTEFKLVTKINTINVTQVTATLIYDNVSISTTRTNDGDFYNFTATNFDLSKIQTNKTFYFNVTLNLINGSSRTHKLTEFNQTILPIMLGTCSPELNTSAVNISIFNEGTTNKINASLSLLVSYWLTGGNPIYNNTYNFTNSDENVSDYYICISPSFKEYQMTGILNYYRSDSDSRDYILTNYTANNITSQISLFLAPTNITDIVTVLVSDENKNYVRDAVIYVQRWEIGTNTFSTVGIITTNVDGRAYINLQLYDVYYRFIVYYQGEIKKTTSPAKLFSTDVNIPITITPPNNYKPFDNIATSLTYNNITSVITYTFLDSSGALSNGCLKVYNKTNLGNVLLSSECSTSVSSTLSYLVLTNETYLAQGILTLNPAYGGVQQIDTLVVDGINRQASDIMKTHGYVLSILLIGTMLTIGIAVGELTISLIGASISLFIINLLGWLVVPNTVFIALFTLFLIVIFLEGRK